jgi:hypothetical protein
MIKIKVFLPVLLIITGLSNVGAQAMDDFGKIALKVQVADTKMTDEAKAALENKMKQIVSHFGIGSTSPSPRFVMEAKVVVTNKDVTATAPQRISQKLEITFYAGDAINQKIFSAITLACTGVGTNETKSLIAAIGQINPQNEKFKLFIEDSKSGILSYYKAECAQIIKEAESQAQQGKYGEAIYRLALIPDVCSDCYGQSLTMQSEYFAQKIDSEGRELLTKARAVWAEQPDGDGAAKVARLISQISPQVSFIQDVHSFADEIAAAVQEQNLREWEQQVKEYNNHLEEAKKQADRNFQLEQQRIRACREIAVEYAKNQPKETYNLIVR